MARDDADAVSTLWQVSPHPRVLTWSQDMPCRIRCRGNPSVVGYADSGGIVSTWTGWRGGGARRWYPSVVVWAYGWNPPPFAELGDDIGFLVLE
jgi:hypothetical protein